MPSHSTEQNFFILKDNLEEVNFMLICSFKIMACDIGGEGECLHLLIIQGSHHPALAKPCARHCLYALKKYFGNKNMSKVFFFISVKPF